MRIIEISICFVLIMCFSLQAQDDLLNTRQKLFSFRQAKVSVGLGLEGGGAMFHGMLPDGYRTEKDTTTILAAAVLIFDIDAPNSRFSFTSGAEYSNQGLLFLNDSIYDQISVRMRQIHIPLFLKFKIGGKFSKSNLLLMVGGSYNIPIKYSSLDSHGFVENNLIIVQNTYSWSSSIVWQINIRGDESGMGTNIPPRIWLYFKCTGLMKSLFNPELQGNIFDYTSEEELDYRDVKLVFGMAYLFSSKNKHEVK